MKPDSRMAIEIVIAKDQPEYIPLPAVRLLNPEGDLITRWELSDAEIERVIESRSIYLTMMTFNRAVTPVMLSVDPPEIGVRVASGIAETREGLA